MIVFEEAGAAIGPEVTIPGRWALVETRGMAHARNDALPTDTSQDHECTDWAAVDEFASDVAAMVPSNPG